MSHTPPNIYENFYYLKLGSLKEKSHFYDGAINALFLSGYTKNQYKYERLRKVRDIHILYKDCDLREKPKKERKCNVMCRSEIRIP